MPSLGADMESGKLLEWRVKPGDHVHRGDIVATVDTSKAEIDVEIFEDGIVDELLIPEGEKVPVGTVLATVRAAEQATAAPEPAPAPPAPPSAPAPPVAPIPRVAPAPPPVVAPASRERVPASPLARRTAARLGLALADIAGSGPGGAVLDADVHRATSAGPVDRATSMRQAIAAAMARSKREIPHYYLATTIDMTAALEWLAVHNAAVPVRERLLPAVLTLKAVALAAREVPAVNGYWTDGALRTSAAVHIGVAISLRQGGLIAPAIHDADHKPLEQLMSDLRDLVQRVRAGGLRSSELTDPTITVTSLGDRGADIVHGVIYPPQVALVGFGAIAERPWVHAGAVTVRRTVEATLAADHRATDGHEGSAFLAAIDRLLQDPEQL
jgi:pyruvate dehydrogenase E2 component (dihydrolipoamide acetyltransferase)